MICVSHPGKIGDALWTLPTVRFLAKKHGCQVDFYTSEVCRPLIRLLEYQPYIRRVVIPPEYRVKNMSCGVQPWLVPVPPEYNAIYHLGFRSYPNRFLPRWIAESVGVPWPLPLEVECPQVPTPPDPYVVLAPRGDSPHRRDFEEFVERCPLHVVQVGSAGEAVGSFGRDLTGLDFLETATWLSGCCAFIGLHSALLVLAAGFPCWKVGVGEGDLQHVLHSKRHRYLTYPTANQLLEVVHDGLPSVQKQESGIYPGSGSTALGRSIPRAGRT